MAVDASQLEQAGALTMNSIVTFQADTRQPMPSSRAAAGERLTFRLGAEEYGIDILRVQEIRGYEAPTRIANAPPFIKGVLNLRGVIVPVVDLRLRFDLKPTFDATTVTVILNVKGRVVGVVVDAVSDVIELGPEQIRAAPQFSGSAASVNVTGIGSVRHGDQERMLILLDIEALMTDAAIGLAEPATVN